MRYAEDGPDIINAPLNHLLDDLHFANLGYRIQFNGGQHFVPNEYSTDYFANQGDVYIYTLNIDLRAKAYILILPACVVDYVTACFVYIFRIQRQSLFVRRAPIHITWPLLSTLFTLRFR